MGNPARRDDYKGPFVFEDVITAEEPRLRPRQATAGGGARMPPSPPAPPSGPTKPPRGPRSPQGGQPPQVARQEGRAGPSILLVFVMGALTALVASWLADFSPFTPERHMYGCTVRIEGKVYGVPSGGTVAINGRHLVCR